MSAFGGVTLSAVFESEAVQYRGKFRDSYAMTSTRYQRRKNLRLMDLNTMFVLPGDSRYFERVNEGEFCVVDVVTREKGWFEWPKELDVMAVHKLIDGHFSGSSFRVGPRLWFV